MKLSILDNTFHNTTCPRAWPTLPTTAGEDGLRCWSACGLTFFSVICVKVRACSSAVRAQTSRSKVADTSSEIDNFLPGFFLHAPDSATVCAGRYGLPEFVKDSGGQVELIFLPFVRGEHDFDNGTMVGTCPSCIRFLVGNRRKLLWETHRDHLA
jgi:hypothetical protein